MSDGINHIRMEYEANHLNEVLQGCKSVSEQNELMIQLIEKFNKGLLDLQGNATKGATALRNSYKNAINELNTSLEHFQTNASKVFTRIANESGTAAKRQADNFKKQGLQKQFQEDARALENEMKVYQDAYRKLERNKVEALNGKKLTPSEFSYLTKSIELSEKKINSLSQSVEKYKGKWSGAASEVRELNKRIQDGINFTKDNTKETIARDSLKTLEKNWESLEKKKQDYINKYGEEDQLVQNITARQKEVTAEMEKQRKVLTDALELTRNKRNADKEGISAANEKSLKEHEAFLWQQQQNQEALKRDKQYKDLKSELQERLSLEEKLAKLQQNPAKHTSEISALKQILLTKRSQEAIEEDINKLPKKYRDELMKIISAQKVQNQLAQAHNDDLEKNNKTLGESLKNFLKFTAYYFVLQKMKQLINEMIDTMKELDKAFTDIQMVTGGTDEQTAQLAKDYNKLAKEVGSTTTEVAEGASEWLRQGKTTEETSQLLKSSMTLSKVGAMESAEATELLTSSLNGYKLEAKDAMSVVDKISAIDLAAATSSYELATALARTANVANDSEVSFDKLLAMIGTVSSVTRRSASTIRRSI